MFFVVMGGVFLHLLVVSVIIFVAAPLFFGAGLPKDLGMYFIVLLVFLFTSITLALAVIALIGVAAAVISAARFNAVGKMHNRHRSQSLFSGCAKTGLIKSSHRLTVQI